MKQNALYCLTVAGLLFSGYLGGVKLFGGSCAFNETCPTFLGYPTCYYGFVVFLLIATLLMLARHGKMTQRGSQKAVLVVSFLGTCFAGYYTFREIPKIFDEGLRAYMLGLPTCAYGFIVYVAIVAISSLLLFVKK